MDKFEQEIKSAYLECKKATTKLNKKSLILGEVLTKEIPRAEIACELGKLFYMQHKFVEAISFKSSPTRKAWFSLSAKI